MNSILKIFRYLAIGLIAIVLVSVGIDAADNYDNLSESIVGRIVFGEGEGPCPPDMIFIPNDNNGFCIDKYEASPGEECPSWLPANQLDTRDNLDFNECVPISVIGGSPWRFISQTQAMTACSKAGKRLPSNEEWYQASLGTPDPDGDWQEDACQVDSNWLEQPGKSGSAENCVSSYGAYDMIGNVWEWVKAEIHDGKLDGEVMPDAGFVSSVSSDGLIVNTSDEKDPNFNEDYLWIKKSGVRGMARGGYWANGAEAGVYAMYLVSPTSFAGDGIGFRCVK